MRINKVVFPFTGLGACFLPSIKPKLENKLSTKLFAYLIIFFVLAGCAQQNADETVGQVGIPHSTDSTGEKISSYRTGNYRVAITREKKNWYKISSQDIFLLTQKCYINATEQEALLSLKTAYKGGNGSLHFEREGCKVIGLYRSMSL
jgi:hypothetical protein